MEKIIEKINSYNLFTNIIPGYLILMFNMYCFNFSDFKIGEQLIIAYFFGQTLNRLGSVLIGKILLKITKEKGESYDKYILASDNDKKINVLLQERNTYRTLCTLFITCIFELLFSKIVDMFNVSNNIALVLLLIVLIVIYAISYCKYNKYIADRVRIYNNKKNK